MPAIVGAGDRIVLPSGRTSSLKRPSGPWTSYGSNSSRLIDRTLSHRQIAVEQPWVSVAVNGMARQISRLPLKVFKRADDGDRNRDRDGDAARRLARPGLRRTATELKYAIACGLLIDGNHVEEKVTLADGNPGLRALDWRWLAPFVLDNEVIGWEYRPPDSPPRLIDVDDVIHYRWQGYKDAGPMGVSPLEHLGITLRNEDAAQRWAESNFRNGTRVGLAVLIDPALKVDQLKREGLREEIEGRYSGSDNAGRPIILGGGVTDVKPIGAQTPVEAALIEQRKVNREEVLAVYNWPPPVAGDLEHATYSNVAELVKVVFKIVLPPWTGLMQEQTTVQLIGGPDPTAHYAEFDYDDAMRGDLIQRVNAFKIALGSGQITPNQVQEAENRPRIDDPRADELWFPTNNLAPLSQVIAATAGAPATGGDPAADQGGRPEGDPGEAPADQTTQDGDLVAAE